MNGNGWLGMGLVACMVLLSLCFATQKRELNKYKALYNKELQNVEAYQSANSGLKEDIRQYQMTMSDLRASKDLLDEQLIEVIDSLKIKDKKIESLQYQSDVIYKEDTIVLKDTIFKNNVNIDTIIGDNWYNLSLNLKYPSYLKVVPTFKSEKVVIIDTKNVYNNTPSKIFFIRWFQKKHLVTEVNVVEKSPYVQNKESKFIKIIK